MPRVPHRLLVVLAVAAVAATAVILARAALNRELQADVLFTVTGLGVFTVIGALIEDRRPGNAVGRINLATGLALAVCIGSRLIAQRLDEESGPLPPAGAVVAVLSSVTFALALVGGSLSLVSRYPDGRLPGRVGRLFDGLILLTVGAVSLQVIRPGPLEYGWVEAVQNPLGIEALRPVVEVGAASLLVAYGAGMTLGAFGLVLRYRRANQRVRAQLRWFLAATAIPIAFLVLLFTSTGEMNEWVWNAWLLSFLLIPLAVGIGVLRYRLYEIDRIISRTLAYAAVTAVLAGVFVVVNLGLGSLVASVTGGSTLAVAASTLLAAALFQPLRRLVQAPIDRRFNRAHVGTAQALATFADQAREEVDLNRLGASVRAVAAAALRPIGVGLWLRTKTP